MWHVMMSNLAAERGDAIARVRAELEESTGVIQALRRQRDAEEGAISRVRAWAESTESGSAAAAVLAILGEAT
jgi:hypothetical protein